MYENYVFDLYGTLVDIHTEENDRNVWEKLALFYGYYGAGYTAWELQQRYFQLVKSGETALKASKQQNMEKDIHYAHEAFPEIQLETVFQELFLEKSVTADKSLVLHTGQFFRALSTEYIHLYDGAKKLLAAIHQSGKKVYLLSNAQRMFTEYELNYLDIAKYFDGILISSDYGTKKPDIRFFQILLDTYHLNPRECIMIGNDAKSDIEGAKAVGMDTYYIYSNLSPQGEKAPAANYVQSGMDLYRVGAQLDFNMKNT